MQGDVLGQVGVAVGGNFVITFTTIPENATVTVKDEKGKTIEPSTDKMYKLKAGNYTYDVVAEGYFSKTEQKLPVLEDGKVEVTLDKKLYVTFILNPTDATLVVKDGSGTVQTAQEDHTYELKAGMYSYSCSKEGFKSVENVSFEMTEDEEEKTINVSLQDASIYGVRRSLTISSTAWERIENGSGKTAKAQTSASTVQNDFDNIKPWSDIKICDVLKDGTVSSYEGDPTFSATSPKGYIMVEIPEFWYKRQQTSGYEYIYISAVEQDGYKKATKRYVGKYDAGGSSSALTSKSGVAPCVNITIANARTAAKKIGTNWGLLDIETWSIIQMLYLVEFADYNCQKVVGAGRSNSSSAVNSGKMDSIGAKSGRLSNAEDGVVYRGMENLWGNVFQWLDGVNFDNSTGQAWISRNQSDYASGKTSSPYTKLGYKCPYDSGYVKEVGCDANNPDIQLPKTYGGSDSTYIPDYSHSSHAVVCVGGDWSNGGYCGLWYFASSSASTSNSDFGCRLLFKPV